MDTNSMKNMIVLKNIQSNMVEEAYVVFKNNVKIHKLEKVDKSKKEAEKDKEKDKPKSKDYMIKEAEMIVNDYISKIEKKEYELVNGNKNLKEKYKRLKSITIFLTVFSALSIFAILFK